ncbi:cingulin-like protein 1 [Panonychus citri]|uniref:cingulin-like protein 1 n=1 Tax=Panonychus citri TaxID=50023 RepID=UPI002307D8C2|nr:cingulin-like protein 1 [Panonychus citri]
MSGKVKAKEQEIASLSTEMSEKNKEVAVVNANLASRIDAEDDFAKYKLTAQKLLADQTEKINKLEKQPNKDSEIYHLKKDLRDALLRLKRWQDDAMAKNVEASKLRSELEILKSERDANLLALQEKYDVLKEETDVKLKKIERDLLDAKSTNSEKVLEYERKLERCKLEQGEELQKVKDQIQEESGSYTNKVKLMEDREQVYQQTLKESRAKVSELQKVQAELRDKIAELVPKEELNTLNQMVESIASEKNAVEMTLKELKDKHDSLANEVLRLNDDLVKQKAEKNQLLEDIERVRRQLYKFKPLVENELTISEDDKVPFVELVSGKIIVHRGYLDNRIIVPHFNDSAFISALGFDAYGYLDKIGRLLTTNEVSMSAEKPAALDFQPHLMFVNSDIVSEHFVGDKSARVLRVLPLRGDEKKQIIHERFMKPHYYPLRSNRMEDVNFILSDETGEQVKFNSGRVCIGLHLKKVV